MIVYESSSASDTKYDPTLALPNPDLDPSIDRLPLAYRLVL